MSRIYSIINQEFVLKEEAKLQISDLAIQRGYGIFDYFRTVDGKPLFLEDHLDRLYHSAREMNLQIDMARDRMTEVVQQLIHKNQMADSGIRITVTGGYSEDGYRPAKPNLLITQMPFTFPNQNFDKGLRLVTYGHQRQLPGVKTIDYLMAIHLQPFVKEHNADDVLYHNQHIICECPRSNFFIVTKKDEVLTPGRNILKGITRKKILGFSEFHTRETDMDLKDLHDAKEAFVTSTTKNVLPVLQVDGHRIGNGNPGEITARIYRKLWEIKEKRG
jgi:D-alanine transaminase/branched-chain amino acid aminotransferase